MSNDIYSMTSIDARAYRRGQMDAQEQYDKKIASMLKQHAEELEALRESIGPQVAAARNLGSSLATEALKNAVLSNLGASNLAVSQKRDLISFVTNLPAPEIPDRVAELTITVEKQAIEISQLKQQVKTQEMFKKSAQAQRAEALAATGTAVAEARADGRVAGLSEAADLVKSMRLQKSPAKNPTKLSADIADRILGLANG